MQGKDNWKGHECEGRLHGVKTYFVRNEIGTVPDDCLHVYFTREYLHEISNLRHLEEFVTKTNKFVTIECNKQTFSKLTPNMRVRAHLIYRIEDEVPHKLKSTDEVMIDFDTYNVLCFTKWQALHVSHADYARDSE